MDGTGDYVIKFVKDNGKTSQEEQKNTEDDENGLLLVHEPHESYKNDVQEEKCSLPACIQTGEKVNPLPEFNNFGLCDKVFSDKCNYAIRTDVLSSEKDYTCRICTKTFTQKFLVTRHFRTHTNDKPFTYTVCMKSFLEKSDLTRHTHIQMRNHSHVSYV